MKVFDLEIYRKRKAIQASIHALENRIGQLALQSSAGSVREMKTCFKEWLKVSSSSR